ncbi:MAG: hypothetical protein JWO67_380 [Streptosporangiaceae bacterium]|nr:hypothetical protein [Streptosporangiaceae bacterium]
MTQTHTTVDSMLDSQTDALVGEWVTLPEAADRLGINLSRTKQLLRDHKLIGMTRDGADQVPSAFVQQGHILKGLPGTLMLLTDAGYEPVEALRWLFTPDETLPGTPVQALIENRGTEVRRRAQALAF